MNLSTTIKSIQDIMRKDDGVDGDAQRIGQLTWMLFLKVFDQREVEWEESANESGQTYISPMPKGCRWRDWTEFTLSEDGKKQFKIPAGELISFINNTLFPKLKKLLMDDPKAKVIHQVFEDSNNYMKSGTLIQGVIEKLDEAIDFNDFTTRQHLGDIYEQVLNDLRSAGNAGEFYTPRAITQIMVQLVNPQINKNEVVMDPACGTGGFLTATIDHLKSQPGFNKKAKNKQILEKSIIGIEKKQLPHLLCVTNLLLHGIDVPSQIEHRNTLGRAWTDWREDEKVDCVITNPPFGGMEDEGVGSDYPEELRTRETADMFLILIVKKLLKDSGRAAVVLPDGALFGEGHKARIKKMLLDTCNLHTIIRLPNGVFAPYTGIKTNLLFFTKGKPTETIWFYEHPYPSGQRSYSKTRPIRLDEFDAEKAWWGKEENDFADRVASDYAWSINFKAKKENAEAQARPYWDKADALNKQASELDAQVREQRSSIKGVTDVEQRKLVEEQIETLKKSAEALRLQAKESQDSGDRLFWPIYNLDIKNPKPLDEENHDPDVLLEKYKKLLADIDETQELLKSELGTALAHHFKHDGV